MYFYPFSFEDLQELWETQHPNQADREIATNKVRTGEQPTVEDRKLRSPVGSEQYKFSEFNLSDEEEDWVYTPIPDELLGKGTAGAWIGPTPKCVEVVIEAITECWRYARDLGEMPFSKTPVDLSDEECIEIMEELDRELVSQYSGWASGAGFEKPPSFCDLALAIEDIRTIVAVIQEAVVESGIKEKIS